MIEKASSEIISAKLADPKYQDRIFKLLWIQNIKTTPGQNLFKVLYRDVRSGMYLTDYVAPELLSHFSIGSYHYNGKLMSIRSEGIEIDVIVKSDNNIKQISECITDDEYNLQHSFMKENGQVDFTEDNKKQYCIEIENEHQRVIFPCAVIGSVYYFLSTSMREQLFAGNLNGLYEDIDIHPITKKAKIIMKPGAAYKDAPHIIRFAKSDYANKRWKSVSNYIRCEIALGKRGSIPLKIDFPVQETFKLKVRGLKFPIGPNKDKILVFDVINDFSPFNFRGLEVIGHERPPSNTDDVVISSQKHKTSDLLVNNTPSSAFSPAIIRDEIGERNENVREMQIEYTLIPQSNNLGDASTFINYEGAEEVDMSVISPESSGDKGTRHGSVVRNKTPKRDKNLDDAFNLEDFAEMIANLRKIKDVSDLEIHEPYPIPLRNKGKKNYTLREVYDTESRNRRKYIYATFTFHNHNVCLIEIDQESFPSGCATYVLVREKEIEFRPGDILDVLMPFVRYETIEQISKKLKIKKIRFLSKNHPSEKGNRYYEMWGGDLLRLILKKSS